MAQLVNLKNKSDVIGALAGALCFVHCLAAPFFFVAQASFMASEASHPWWWSTLDVLFLATSFFAVYWSAKNTAKRWIQYAFWCLWSVLALLVIDENLEISPLAEETIYLPTLALVVLHLYNRRFCRCNDDNCCTV